MWVSEVVAALTREVLLERPFQYAFRDAEARLAFWWFSWWLSKFPGHCPQPLSASLPGFNSLVGAVMGFSILLSAEVFKHDSAVWYLDGSIGVLIGLTIFAYGVK